MNHILILGDVYRQIRFGAFKSLAFLSILLILAGCGGGGGGENVGPEPTLASFSSSVTEGDYDLTVEFTDTSTGEVDSWLWDFGDGNGSTEANPIHTYTAEGIYTVTLTVTGPSGEDTTFCQDCITVTTPAPVAAFDLDPDSGTYDLTINFTDLSSGPIDSWLWDFGDGNTSTDQNPTHLYTEEGLYSITLQVEGPGG
ncbi:MAG: PKD domain-containing protein, partial [Planctomycetota bacterium]